MFLEEDPAVFTLPPLPYAYDALTPVMSEQTLRTHHGKHHARYIEVTNSLLAGQAPATLEAVVAAAEAAGDAKLFNNAAQALNHAFFWSCMSPQTTRPSGPLAEAIAAFPGGAEGLKERFLAEGAGHFGSGWVWLVSDRGALGIVSTHDAATTVGGEAVPLLVCDVWEHAYYLDHKNDRAAFLKAWWDRAIDWDFASAQHRAAREGGALWSFERAQALAAAAG